MAEKISAQTDWEEDEFDEIEDYEPSDDELKLTNLNLNG